MSPDSTKTLSSNSSASSDDGRDQNCLICLEISTQDLKEQLDCGHAFCRSCLAAHVEHTLRDRRLPIPCPTIHSVIDCATYLEPHVVEMVVDDATEYHRLVRLHSNPHLRTCTRCDELVDVDEEVGLDDSNLRQCPACAHKFCAEHGDLHPKLSCAEYEATANAAALRASEASIREWTRPCSHCSAALFKASGCDHVVCPHCQADMCFRCGTHEYLSGKVIRSCSRCRQGYVDHRHAGEYRLRLVLLLPFMLPGWIIYMAASGIMAILSGCFCCCFGCGTQVMTKNGETKRRTERVLDPWLGIRQGIVTLFLPVIVFLRDMGVDCGCLEAVMFTETPLELPKLEVDAESKGSSVHSESAATAPSTPTSYGSLQD